MTRDMPDLEEATAAPGVEARRLFDAQHAASRREPAPDLASRLDRLARLRTLVADNERAFVAAISDDFGHRSPFETSMMEALPLLGAIRYARRHLAAWMKPEKRATDLTFQPATSHVRREPLGVVGIISPWNYPLMLALSPLVDVLAAGNRALIKPSELTPAFSELLRGLVAKHFAPEEVAVVTGDAAVAAAFAALPFDHLVFTGSTAVGRKVMAAAAQNLTPVTLELGGKSPVIVCEDYSAAAAARSVAIGKFVNAGQTCIAPDYVLVPKNRTDAFADALMTRLARMYPRIAGNPDYTAIVSQRHYTRLVEAIEQARAAGAEIRRHGEDDPASRRLAPTVVLGAPADGLLLSEEIFGPLLPIVSYDSLDEALAFVAARERPLALYAFSRDSATIERVLAAATSGGVTLNGTLLHIAQETLPFGGIGPSGLGSYHGRDGFLRFSHARAVHSIGRFSAFERMGPPWGRVAGLIAAFIRRRG